MPNLPAIRGEVIIDFTEVGQAATAVKGLGTTVREELAGTKTTGALGGLSLGLTNVGKSVEATAQKVSGPLAKVQSSMSTLAGSFGLGSVAAGLAGGSILAFASKAMGATNAAGQAAWEMSQKFGIGGEEASRWVSAGGQVGAGLDVMSRGFRFLGKNMEAVNLGDQATQGRQLDAVNKQIESSTSALAKAQQRLGDVQAGLAGKTSLTLSEQIRLRDAQQAVKDAQTKLNEAQSAGLAIQEGAASDAKGVAQAFASLGVPLKDAHGNLRNMQDVLFDVADRFKDMPDGAEKAGLAFKLFGRGGQDMIQILNLGSAGIREMMANSDELGTTMSGPQVEAAHQAYLAEQRLGESMRGLGKTIGETLEPIVVILARSLAPVIGGLSRLVDSSPLARAALVGLAAAVMVLAAAMAVLAIATLGVTWPMLAIIGAVALVAAAAYLVVSNWGPISGWFVGLWRTVESTFTTTWRRLTTWLLGIWNAIAGAATGVWNAVAGFFTGVWNGAVGVVMGVVHAFELVGSVIASVVVGAFNVLVGIGRAVWSVMLTIATVVNDVTTVIGRIFLTAFAVWLGLWIWVFETIWSLVQGPLNAVWNLIWGFLQQVRAGWVNIWNGLLDVLGPVWLGIQVGWQLLSALLAGVWADIAGTATSWWNAITGAITWFVQAEWTGIQLIWRAVTGFLGGVWANIYGTGAFWWSLLSGLLGGALNYAWTSITSTWDGLRTWLGGVWAGISGTAGYWWGTIAGTITGWAGGIRDTLGGIWNAIADTAGWAAGQVWQHVKDGLNTAIGIANQFIGKTNSALGFLGFKVPPIPELQRGGKTDGPVYLVGEGRAPEYVIPTDPGYRHNAQGLWLAAGREIGMLEGGGIVGMLTAPIRTVVNAALGGATGWGRTVAENLAGYLFDRLGQWITDRFKALGGGGGGRAAAGQLADWINAGIALAGVPFTWFGPLSTLIQRESGGNPRAINLWDVNAQRGDPSRGLMQTIGATFERYRLASLPDDIYDPVANIVAGIRYILDRYGSIFNVQQAVGATPQGYAGGGITGRLVRLFDGGGYWPSGELGFNGSGGTELVLTEEQARRGPDVKVTQYISGSGASAEMVADAAVRKLARALR